MTLCMLLWPQFKSSRIQAEMYGQASEWLRQQLD